MTELEATTEQVKKEIMEIVNDCIEVLKEDNGGELDLDQLDLTEAILDAVEKGFDLGLKTRP